MNLDYLELLFRGKKFDSVFKQVARSVLKQRPKDLCFPSRAWKIRLVDEAADDAGGVFDEIMTEMCQVSPDDFVSPLRDCFHLHMN